MVGRIAAGHQFVFPGAGAHSQKSNRGKESVFKPPSVFSQWAEFSILQRHPRSKYPKVSGLGRKPADENKSTKLTFSASLRKKKAAPVLLACWLRLQSWRLLCGLGPWASAEQRVGLYLVAFFSWKKKGHRSSLS